MASPPLAAWSICGAEVAQRFAQQMADADEVVDDQVALFRPVDAARFGGMAWLSVMVSSIMAAAG
jgi:hypothetical protein